MRRLDFQHLPIDRSDVFERFGHGFTAHGVVPKRFLIEGVVGRHIGKHPVVTAVLAAVLDVAEELLAATQGVPHEFEYAPWHIGVANDVMGKADQFGFGEARDAHERAVDVGDFPF